jgi:ketosteroid isomerase-like protein
VSETNLEIVRRPHEAWSRRDVDAALELVHEDIEWHPALTAGGLEGTAFHGPAGIRTYFRQLDEVWAELSHEVDEIRDLGDRVLVLARFHPIGRESGATVDQPTGLLFTGEGEKVVLAHAFATREQALRAAGLEG